VNRPTAARAITARWGVVDGPEGRRIEREPVYLLDAGGKLVTVGAGAAVLDTPEAPTLVEDLGPSLVLPGLVNAHSHAFQRSIRGQTQSRGADDPSSFWSWRDAMYRAANTLDPDAFEAATRACFAEMLASGITCVGEFHYVHHGPNGAAYDEPNELSHRVVAAARDVGIRLALLEVYYARSGPGQAPLAEQRRFCDGSVDAYLERVQSLLALRDDHLWVGLAPHSVRAVGAEDLRRIAQAAAELDLPIHAHVSEQPAENEACHDEHERSPTQVFADAGCLDDDGRFTAVHAIFVGDGDIARLARQHVCACPTTEADLGDGIVPAEAFAAAGTRMALGSDSNAVIDLVQEARLLEMDARLRTGARLRLPDAHGRVATTLLDAATLGGAASLHRHELGRLAVGSPFDACVVDLDHRTLRDVPRPLALDALFTAGTAAPIREVFVAGDRRA